MYQVKSPSMFMDIPASDRLAGTCVRLIPVQCCFRETHREHTDLTYLASRACAAKYSQKTRVKIKLCDVVQERRRNSRAPGLFPAASIAHRVRSHTPPSLPSTTDRSASVCRARVPPSVASPSARERRSINAVDLSSSHCCGGRRPLSVDSPSGVVGVVGDSSVAVAGCWGAVFLGPVHVFVSSAVVCRVV